MEKESFLLAAFDSGLQVWKCTGCGSLAVSEPGAGKVRGACPTCETALLIVPLAMTQYSLKVEN